MACRPRRRKRSSSSKSIRRKDDQGSDRVAPEFDYAILPGDRIVVTEDPSSFIDDLMQPVLRPLGMANRNDRKAKVAAKYNVRD